MTSTIASIAAPDQPTVGSLIDEYYSIRELYREASKIADDYKSQMKLIEEKLLELFDGQGVSLCRGNRASASLSETTIPIVDDWERVEEFMDENDARYLQERRISNAAWRELHDSGTTIPGTRPFVRRTLSVRKLK